MIWPWDGLCSYFRGSTVENVQLAWTYILSKKKVQKAERGGEIRTDFKDGTSPCTAIVDGITLSTEPLQIHRKEGNPVIHIRVCICVYLCVGEGCRSQECVGELLGFARQ